MNASERNGVVVDIWMHRADNVMLERLFNSWRTRPRAYASTTLLRGDAATYYHYYRY